MTKSSYGFEDFVRGFSPDKRFRVFIGEHDVLFDGMFESLSAAMKTSFNLSLGEQGKPTFHQIEPRAAGGSEVQMKTRMFGQPSMNQSGFVSCIVI